MYMYICCYSHTFTVMKSDTTCIYWLKVPVENIMKSHREAKSVKNMYMYIIMKPLNAALYYMYKLCTLGHVLDSGI